MASSLSQGAAALVIDATAASFDKKRTPGVGKLPGANGEERVSQAP